MPFSTLGYQHDHEHWAKWFPADLVTECFPGQFRNWFYALLTMSAVLEDRAPFKTLVGHALVRNEKGEEMHKSKGNAIWFDDAAEQIGADVMRWMFSSQNPAINLNFGPKLGQEVRRRLITLWNAASFFVTYANLDNPDLAGEPGDSLCDMDRWIRSRIHSLIRHTTAALERYDTPSAVRAIEDFIEDLSNWYIRRNRRRFWKGPRDADKTGAYRTLHGALTTMAKLLAPILPFTAEEMHQALARPADPVAPESVHLCDWPCADEAIIDSALEESMAAAMAVARLGLAARNQAGVKVRQPLRAIHIFVPNAAARQFLERLQREVLEELNVKELHFADGFATLQEWRAAMEADRALSLMFVEEGGFGVALDTAITPKLRLESIARDFVRHVQTLRKSSGLEVQDRILMRVYAPADIAEALKRHCPYIQSETLAREILFEPNAAEGATTVKLAGHSTNIWIAKAP